MQPQAVAFALVAPVDYTTEHQDLQDLQARCIESALSSLAPASCRVYRARIQGFVLWLNDSPLDREHVQKYLRSLELRGATAQVRNQTLAALKKLATEAAEIGWIDHASALQVERIKAKRTSGVRTGKWLNVAQAKALLEAPDRTTVQGIRDGVVLALLLGCGLRRAEACSLETAQLERLNGKLLLRNLVGKGNRVRSIAVPEWSAQRIEEWKAQL
jgi:site-specific recombinase XerD